MKIRKANMKDLKDILWMFNNTKEMVGSDGGYYVKDNIKQYIQGPVFVTFIAEVDKKIAGVILIQVWKKAKYTYIENIVVKKEFRGKRIGYELMKFVDDYYKKKGSKFIFFYTEENNKVMKQLSKKFNYNKGKKYVFYSKGEE